MTHPFIDQQTWQQLKQGIIQLAQQEVLSRFEKVSAETKDDGSLLTEADTQMQAHTKAFLKQHWPQFALLGEESTLEEQQAAMESEQGCWILDPVDGTSNFACGIPFYSVSLALMIKGELVLGLVYDPSRNEMFAARKGLGAELNDQTLIASTAKNALKQCSGIVDFKRLQAPLAANLATQPPYSSQRSFGSVALDWCWIAAGRGQIYLHGAQNIWDYAAGWLILEEAGGKSATLDGECVVVTQVIKRSALAATTPDLFTAWQNHLQHASQ
ncbi:inositol monophosphatase [Thiomicrorhabdus sp. zzn3]|uniref:inositol monophosphatase family protein n=1 Tax=Thiomicrorhabdus sp. zzn3 TaxID=3039775 RepID=UPI002437091F|nr:inositol monophosphatase [Thiomicrorhabdus sp. zzn3]MDG6777441.1 inositol monophosphatase [Thiomicrorhabdus sp. zzn3]